MKVVSVVRKAFQLFKDYLSCLPIFIISFYFVTAQPDGRFSLTWNPLNLLLVCSYLLTYPLALRWLPFFHNKSLYMQSYVTLGISHYPHHAILYDKLKLRDDIVSVMAIWALHGIVFLFSIPVVIVIGCFRIMRALLHPK
ncbi:hypothetical protein LXEBMM8_EKPBGFGD_01134 [Lactiplantibacillus xiangfangensis]